MERLKSTEDAVERRRLIGEGRLPYETVVGATTPDKALWQELMQQMPFMALLRHLNTLDRVGVLADSKAVDYVVERLTNRAAVAKSMVLPYRFFIAYHTLAEGVPRRIREAVEEALELSFANMPPLPGMTCIAPDVSGSMSCGSISDRGKARYIDIAAIFAAACLKQSVDAIVLPFEHRVVDVRLSARDTLMTTADHLAKVGGGGTAVGAPVSELIRKRTRVDTLIGITDGEDWCYGCDGRSSVQSEEGGFLNAWRTYRTKVNKDAKAFLLTLAPYRHAVAPPEEPGVWFIYGWSDAVLPFITRTLQGGQSQMDAVHAVSLHSPT